MSIEIGTKYLLRATFLYANYDNLNSPFELFMLLDVDVWDKISMNDESIPVAKELIFMAKFNTTSVFLGCGSRGGVPMISSLELHTLEGKMY